MSRVAAGGFVTAAAVFLIDQAVKLWVTVSLGIDHLGAYREIVSFFDLRFVPNIGVSLGLLPAGSDAMRWGIVALTAAIALGVAVWMTREANRYDRLALGLVFGGAIGNILDRIRLGYVIDFADLHIGTWRPFLVFNVADAAITIGVLVLLVRALLIRDKKTDAAQAPVENSNA
ncbi:signal peptidase II [Sphingomonas qilianensis]|uniref:Lipoprotein signal peptidase n=1 Tax=Sphingomonas qilianensis TaxID=1736690 RepID=A0ABU9XUC7_9SPHN